MEGMADLVQIAEMYPGLQATKQKRHRKTQEERERQLHWNGPHGLSLEE
jgi:hypothetical protein